MTNALVLVWSLFFCSMTLAQTPVIEWEKSFGGSGWDEASSVQQTMDGGYIIAGTSNSANGDVTDPHGGRDIWIVKLDSGGETEWNKSLGGSLSDGFINQVYYSSVYIIQTMDEGYIIAGSSNSADGDVTNPHGKWDIWVVKLDYTGEIAWEKSFGGSEDDIAASIQQTTEGGYILAGTSNSSDGDITDAHGGDDYWIVKLDSIGGIVWEKSFGGPGIEEAASIQQTMDGGYIVAGYSWFIEIDTLGPDQASYWVVKLDPAGNLDWERTLCTPAMFPDYCAYQIHSTQSVLQATDGGYIIAGNVYRVFYDFGLWWIGDSHGWVVKLDAIGESVWETRLDVCVSPPSIQPAADGGFVIASTYYGDYSWDNSAWIFMIDSTGESVVWHLSFPEISQANCIQRTSDGGYIVVGWKDGDFWTVRLSASSVHLSDLGKASPIKLFPNPSSGTLNVQVAGNSPNHATIRISDLSGKTWQSSIFHGARQTLDVSALPPGLYLMNYDDGTFNSTLKFAVIH